MRYFVVTMKQQGGSECNHGVPMERLRSFLSDASSVLKPDETLSFREYTQEEYAQQEAMYGSRH